MDDLISRQAAIDALSHMMDTDGFRDGWAVSRANVDCMLRSLPSAQPERKRGKWISVTNGRGGHECNLCHTYAPSFQSGDEWLTDYCPNCGADMRGKQDE